MSISMIVNMSVSVSMSMSVSLSVSMSMSLSLSWGSYFTFGPQSQLPAAAAPRQATVRDRQVRLRWEKYVFCCCRSTQK
mgnify:CR=1 FL=1